MIKNMAISRVLSELSELSRSTKKVTYLTLPLALLAALLVGAMFILMAGANPLDAYLQMIRAGIGSKNAISESLVKAVPLAMIALGTTVAFRCKVWNIGGEGQLTAGSIATVGVALAIGEQPKWLLLPLLIVVGFLGGAFWGSLPGILKAKFNVNEIISSLMFNYVAILFASYLVNGPWREEHGFVAQTPLIPRGAVMPNLLAQTRLHAGVIVAVVFAILVYIVLWKTVLGYRIRAVGANSSAAEYSGISVNKHIVLAMVLSGGLAGVAGMMEISALHGRLIDGLSMGYGFTGIVVALLGRLHPFGALFAALLFGILVVGADGMQFAAGVPVFIVYIIQALVVLFLLGADAFTQWRK